MVSFTIIKISRGVTYITMNQKLKRKLFEFNVNEYNKYINRRKICVISFLYLSEQLLETDRR